jgi:phage protein D
LSEQTYTNLLEVRLEGAPLTDRVQGLLLSCEVDSSMNLPSAFELTFSDPYSEITEKEPKLAVGTKVELVPIAEGKPGKPLLTGEITALELDADRTGRTLRVRGYDKGHRLLRNRRVEGYPNATAADIVRKLAGKNSVQLGKVDSTRTVYELATQPNITDWDFLTRLAVENDVYLYVDRAGKLQFTARRDASGAPSPSTSAARSPFVLEFGKNMISCRAGVTSAGQLNTVSARGWDVKTKRPLVADSPATKTDGTAIGVTPAQLTSKFGSAELTEAEEPYTTQAQVQQTSKALADDVASSFAELEVSVRGTPELEPGVPVALNGGGKPFEGRYTVTSTRHVFTTGQPYTTWVTVSGRQVRSLYGLASGGVPTAPIFPGVVNALVTNIKDPNQQNRVKLKFPWLSDTYETEWCRVAQLGGVRGGGLVMPEVDDEVLVSFDRGSLEHPYVLAGLYNGRDEATKEPDRLDAVDRVSGKVNWRSMASRSGHIIELLDAPTRAKSGIRMETGNGSLTVYLDQTKSAITVNSDGSVTIKGNRSVSVEAGANLSLRAGGTMSINAGGALSIRAGGALSLNALGALSASATGSTSITSGLATTITSGAAATITAGAAITVTAPGAVAITGSAINMTGVLLHAGVVLPF